MLARATSALPIPVLRPSMQLIPTSSSGFAKSVMARGRLSDILDTAKRIERIEKSEKRIIKAMTDSKSQEKAQQKWKGKLKAN